MNKESVFLRRGRAVGTAAMLTIFPITQGKVSISSCHQ